MRRNYNRNKGNPKNSKTVRHSKENALSETELKQLIDGAEDYFDKLIIILSGYHGMREGEIAHMEKTWIDFQKEIIRIPPEKKCNCYECIQRIKRTSKNDGLSDAQIDKMKSGIWMPKTKKSIRAIPLRYDVPIVKEVIQKFFSYHRRVGCSRQTIYLHITDIAKKVGLTKKIHPHSLRATAGSLFGLKGFSAPTLCSIMGWNDIQTANKYVTADEESALQEAKWRLGISGGG